MSNNNATYGFLLLAAACVLGGGCRCLPDGRAPDDGVLVTFPTENADTGGLGVDEVVTVFATDLTACALDKLDGELVFEVKTDPASVEAARRLFRAFRSMTGASSKIGDAPYSVNSLMTKDETGSVVWHVSLVRNSDRRIIYGKALKLR